MLSTTRGFVAAVSVLVAGVPRAALAQNLYFTSGATTLNAPYNSVNVGIDSNGATIDPATNQPYVATVNLAVNAQVNEARSYNASAVNINGGRAFDAFAYDTSVISLTDGIMDNVSGYDNSTVNISGGGNDLAYFYDNSVFNLSGGVTTGPIGYDNSVLNISGGRQSGSLLYDHSTVNLSGGDIGLGGFRLFNDGVVNIFGSDLFLSSAQAGNDGFGNFLGYSLSGTLQDGTNAAGISIRDYTGIGSFSGGGPGSGILTFTANGTAAAPEPGSIALFGIGLAMGAVAVRRRHASK